MGKIGQNKNGENIDIFADFLLFLVDFSLFFVIFCNKYLGCFERFYIKK
jgi:hypothetical protein